MKKKILSLIIAFMLFCGIGLPSKTAYAKEETLTIYSWEDYIDLGYEQADIDEGLSESLTSRFSNQELTESVIEQFENETGIKVNYCTFATNEEMYNELKNNPNGADLVCPSEYMIMKMKDEGMLKSYETPTNWANYGSPYIRNKFKELGLTDGEDKVYAVGYMWGTMGYIYNAEFTSSEELKNWDSIMGEKFKSKSTIKDSIRDTYIMAVGAVYKDELLALKEQNPVNYNELVTEIFNRTDDDSVSKVEEYLKSLKKNIYGFEVDSGKNDMLDGKIEVNFAWSGDAVYAIDQAAEIDKEFCYVVPEEGSNIWFDGFVMPKNANSENAKLFLDFICQDHIAIRNMEYIGYTSCMAQEEIFNYVKEQEEDGTESIDLTYFFKDSTYSGTPYSVTVSSQNSRLATQFPSGEVIKRCAVMKNFSETELQKINDMWNRVKFITLPTYVIIVVVICALLVVCGLLIYKFRDKIFAKKIRGKKLKVISKEVIR